MCGINVCYEKKNEKNEKKKKTKCKRDVDFDLLPSGFIFYTDWGRCVVGLDNGSEEKREAANEGKAFDD